jgi:olefin beta-lactone synthetase
MSSIEYSRIGRCDGRAPENNVISFLDKHAQSFPQKTALQWVARTTLQAWDGKKDLAHEAVTYKKLVDQINAVSGGLKKIGIGKGDRVIIFVPLSPELYVTMFAVQRIGAIAVFLDSWARKDHLGACAAVVGPKAMISFEKAFDLCAAVPGLADIPCKVVVGQHDRDYSSDLESLSRSPDPADIEPVESHDTALITFTTGSSGSPKGADRTHRFLAAQHRALDKEIPYNEADRDLPVFPIFSLNNLAGGVTTILPAIDLAAPSDKDAGLVINQLVSAGVTCCTVSPSIFVNIARYCRENKITLNGLRRVVTGGAPVSTDNVRDFKAIAPAAHILVLYGSTEVEPIAHIDADEMLSCAGDRQGVNVGRISEDLEHRFIKIRRANIELGTQGWREWEAEAGKPGELVVSGAHVCENYYNDPEAVKSTKIKESTGKVWHRTGDVGVFDEHKNLWLLGRVHNTIVRRGEYLFPVHPEILLKSLDFVKQAAYAGIEDKELGERTCVVISLRDGASISQSAAFLDKVKVILAQHGYPADDIKIVREIPMDPRHHSKVEYSRVREMMMPDA